MKITSFILVIYYIRLAKGSDVDSYEINRIEFPPLHDAIILNDIVDILSEFDNMNPQINNHMLSNSESEEDIENLLSEYQQYLDKAHEQRINYIRKTKSKNKIPPLRYEKFNKLKPIERSNHDENSNFYFDDTKYPTAIFNSFIPHNPNVFLRKNDKPFDFSKTIYDGKKTKDLHKIYPENMLEPISPSCFCQENITPCKCQCKKCFYPGAIFSKNSNKMNHFTTDLTKSSKYAEDNPSNLLDNNDKLYVNLRIKIDVQVPNISVLSNILKYRNKFDRNEEHEDALAIPKEILPTINIPFPYKNFPIPMEIIGYKQNIYKDKSVPIHKITIHKKKKFRFGNNNKKHKNKKMYTLQNVKFEPQVTPNVTITQSSNNSFNKNYSFDNHEDTKQMTNMSQISINKLNNTNDNTTVTPRIVLTINITKGTYNRSEHGSKIENSIETGMEIEKDNASNKDLMRLKRAINTKLPKYAILNNDNKNITRSSVTLNSSYIPPQVISIKKLDTDSESDTELLYWPSAKNNQSLIHSKNITALILDREIKKTKMNMTKDKIRSNHTTALEKAIFGDVDWDDIDAVVPVFISFVGKYITGVLTFCSQSICHSVKCAKKVCMHRMCTPDNRSNNKGHCAGNNYTDSVATMESIMDLPSNIAFEVVDILEEKMLGKLFGKGTLCIHSNCSAFVAFKKTFKKSKCTYKELNLSGHCPNLKHVKITQ